MKRILFVDPNPRVVEEVWSSGASLPQNWQAANCLTGTGDRLDETIDRHVGSHGTD
jgi:hypothetical protein